MQCSCKQCRALCLGTPGWFMPGQVTLAAKFMKMSLREFFDRYLIVEYWVDCDGDVNLLAPRRDFQLFFFVPKEQLKWGIRDTVANLGSYLGDAA
jgi:hypothetical protein